MVNVFFETSFLEYPDKGSLAVVLSFSGCSHHCPECHSPISQVYERPNAEEYREHIPILTSHYYKFDNYIDLYCAIRELCERNCTDTIVLSGGDPFFEKNEDMTLSLLECLIKYKTCVYTGFDIDYIKEKVKHIQNKNIIYKCGTYKDSLKVTPEKTDSFMQLASTNQNFYDNNFNQISTKGKILF